MQDFEEHGGAADARPELSTPYGFKFVVTTRVALMAVFAIAAVCGAERRSSPVIDAIPGIPRDAQRHVSRSELGLLWPLQIGQGTIGCSSGAVVFRAGGIDYALNDAARSRGFKPVDPIWEYRSEGWPSNPLKRIPQDRRKRIYADLAACEKRVAVEASTYKQRVQQSAHLTDAEIEQIKSEGIERRWPPQTPNRKSLDALINEGAKLCPSKTPTALLK